MSPRTSVEGEWYLTLSRESTPHLSGDGAYVIGIVHLGGDSYTNPKVE